MIVSYHVNTVVMFFSLIKKFKIKNLIKYDVFLHDGELTLKGNKYKRSQTKGVR